MRDFTRAFSLVELLVVISIVGILAAVSIPVYKEYRIRVAVTNVLVLLHGAQTSLLESASKNGVFPSTVNFAGITVDNSSWHAVSGVAPISYIYYDTSSSNGLGYQLEVVVSGSPFTSIPSFSPVVGNLVNSAIGVGGRIFTSSGVDTIRTVCGQQGPGFNAQYIPLTYFPPACQCSDITSFFRNGTVC